LARNPSITNESHIKHPEEGKLKKIKKSQNMRLLVLNIILFLSGIVAGTVIQKTIGLGNVLRAAGIPYPTSLPSGFSSGSSPVEILQEYRGSLSLFILVVQSNMVGWAPIPKEQRTDPRIYVFGNDYQWHIASEPVDTAYNQVDQVSLDRLSSYGPSLAFAQASLDRHPDQVIGLIPCAKNSSSIGQWQRNLSDQSLYGSCLKRARAASTMGHISGVLFFQGETDALDPNQYPNPEPSAFIWAELFSGLVSDLRNDLQEPDLPVIFAQIGQNTAPEAFTNWEVVKDQQLSVQMPVTAMITTDDLPLMDGLHFTTEGYQIIGARFASAYWETEGSGEAVGH
jgi:hypothetical protein